MENQDAYITNVTLIRPMNLASTNKMIAKASVESNCCH
jgi:hypothetical protein